MAGRRSPRRSHVGCEPRSGLQAGQGGAQAHHTRHLRPTGRLSAGRRHAQPLPLLRFRWRRNGMHAPAGHAGWRRLRTAVRACVLPLAQLLVPPHGIAQDAHCARHALPWALHPAAGRQRRHVVCMGAAGKGRGGREVRHGTGASNEATQGAGQWPRQARRAGKAAAAPAPEQAAGAGAALVWAGGPGLDVCACGLAHVPHARARGACKWQPARGRPAGSCVLSGGGSGRGGGPAWAPRAAGGTARGRPRPRPSPTLAHQ